MPFQESEQSTQSFYSRFKDKTMSASQKRGAVSPKWEDVLMVATEVPETQNILHDQGISGAGLHRDIEFSLYYGRPKPKEGHLIPLLQQNVYSQAINELRQDMVKFAQSQDFLNYPDNQKVAHEFLEMLNSYLDDKQESLKDLHALDVLRVKENILRETLNGFMQQMKPIFPEGALPEDMDDETREVAAEANRQFTGLALEQFGQFALEKGKVIVTDDQPLLLLDVIDQVERSKIGQITPYQVIDTAQKTVDPFLRYILYRNGLVTPENYEAPYSMPSPTIIAYALTALEFVESNRQKNVEPAHMLPSLLADGEIIRLLMDLDEERNISEKPENSPMAIFFDAGPRKYFRDFIKFYHVVKSSLAPEREEANQFRYHPKITDQLREFLHEAEETVKDGSKSMAPARLFGKLLEREEVREIFVKAGLTPEQLDRWPEVMKKGEEKKRKEEAVVKDKLDKPFKVDDKQLEDLLEEYGEEKTKLALEGKLDPVVGREKETREIMRILMQKGKSNPILLGEAGVGKSALFNKLAQKIASGDAPKVLIGARVIEINLAKMNSGAMFRGQFEGRLLPVVEGVSERNAKGDKPPIILCIDELHSALDAGTASGTPGASELLKPPLAKGELSIVGATTQRDYAKHIKIDAALDRRFEPVFIEAPNREDATTIVRGLRETYTTYHKLEFPEDLIPTVVKLTDRYLPNLNQPDKAISILDAACAYAKLHDRETVDMGLIIDVIATAAKLDPRFLQENEGARYLRLKDELRQQVVGQEGVDTIANALIIAKADLHNPRQPLGKFLLLGPTGTGKTETARALAEILFGTPEALIRIDMSNMMDKHEGSRLFGAPPGYVGYGEEGELSGRVRQKPYAVVLLDEIEKADPETVKRLLPIFEEGEITDGSGRTVSFRNTIILMTSNLGVTEARREYNNVRGKLGAGSTGSWKNITDTVFEKAAKEHFPPEFLNRLDSQIIYNPLAREHIKTLVGREIDALAGRAQERWDLTLDFAPEIYAALAKKGYNDEYGARFLKRTVINEVIQPVALWILQNEDKLVRGTTLDINGTGDKMSLAMRV